MKTITIKIALNERQLAALQAVNFDGASLNEKAIYAFLTGLYELSAAPKAEAPVALAEAYAMTPAPEETQPKRYRPGTSHPYDPSP